MNQFIAVSTAPINDVLRSGTCIFVLYCTSVIIFYAVKLVICLGLLICSFYSTGDLIVPTSITMQ